MKNLKEILQENALSRSSRLKRSKTMKKNQKKIRIAKEKAARKMASPEKIRKRARKQAVDKVKSKYMKKIFTGGVEPTIADKENLERFIAKKKGAIDKIAKKLEKKVRQQEKERLMTFKQNKK